MGLFTKILVRSGELTCSAEERIDASIKRAKNDGIVSTTIAGIAQGAKEGYRRNGVFGGLRAGLTGGLDGWKEGTIQ